MILALKVIFFEVCVSSIFQEMILFLKYVHILDTSTYSWNVTFNQRFENCMLKKIMEIRFNKSECQYDNTGYVVSSPEVQN